MPIFFQLFWRAFSFSLWPPPHWQLPTTPRRRPRHLASPMSLSSTRRWNRLCKMILSQATTSDASKICSKWTYCESSYFLKEHPPMPYNYAWAVADPEAGLDFGQVQQWIPVDWFIVLVDSDQIILIGGTVWVCILYLKLPFLIMVAKQMCEIWASNKSSFAVYSFPSILCRLEISLWTKWICLKIQPKIFCGGIYFNLNVW